MNYKEYSFTASEITQLEYMLSIMPDDMDRANRPPLPASSAQPRSRHSQAPAPVCTIAGNKRGEKSCRTTRETPRPTTP